MTKSRFGGKITVQDASIKSRTTSEPIHHDYSKPFQSKKDKKSKPFPGRQAKEPSSDDIFRPISTHTGGGISLPAQAMAPRVVQSATIQAHLMNAFKNNGDTQQFLGHGAMQGLWIGIPMWASSAWDSHPVPGCLPLEWLSATTGLPVGTTITLAGGWGASKSTLAMEFLRYVDMYRGFGHYVEHESKLSPNLFRATVGDSVERILVERADSVDHWQQIVLKHISAAIQTMKTGVKIPVEITVKGKKKIVERLEKIGRSVLLGIVVDTIFGKMSRENQGKTIEKGHGDRSYAIEALQITNFLKTLPNIMEQYPVLLILVSQTKFAKDKQGLEVKTKAGGNQVQFVESFDLELRKVKPIRFAGYEGMRVKIKNDKNSFGNDKRQIEVDVIKWEEPDALSKQGWSLRNIYDWNTATVELLEGEQIKGRFRENLNKAGWHLSTNKGGGNTGRCWSKTLGVSSKDPVSYREMGDMIHRNPEVLTMIRRALRIQEINYLDGDMFKQRERIRIEHDKQSPNILARLVAQHVKEATERNEKKQKNKESAKKE